MTHSIGVNWLFQGASRQTEKKVNEW